MVVVIESRVCIVRVQPYRRRRRRHRHPRCAYEYQSIKEAVAIIMVHGIIEWETVVATP